MSYWVWFFIAATLFNGLAHLLMWLGDETPGRVALTFAIAVMADRCVKGKSA